jgi:DNA-damage-inducible protein J
MSQKAVVRARIEQAIKDEAVAVLDAVGYTVSDLFRILLIRIAREHEIPFQPLIPNEETIEAMKEARNGTMRSCNSVKELMEDLHVKESPCNT